MKIVTLVPGLAGSFYCENCLRDAGLVKALRKTGHEVLMVPLYLPLLADGTDQLADTPVFFGGVNVYLQQKWALFRKTPRWIDRLFDSPRLLKWVARKATMTSSRDLGETTLSMLSGPSGRQGKELARLIRYLASEARPDVISLSNALLIGMAGQIKAHLGAPIVVMLQDEDIFVDGLPEPYRTQSWQAIAEQARQIDAFIAVSRYYAQRMQELLHLPTERVHIVHPGIETVEHDPPSGPVDPPAIGFLQRMRPEKGLDLLAEAFVILKRSGQFDSLKLRVTGGKTAEDESFIRTVRDGLKDAGVIEDVEFIPNLDEDGRRKFMRGLSVLSVPTRHPEAFGLYVLEALAAAVPVVLPDRGAFGELLAATGGGLLCKPDDPQSLAEQLATVLSDGDLARRLGSRGRQAVRENFNLQRTAAEMLQVYESIASK